MTVAAGIALAAVALFGLFVVLGLRVSHRPLYAADARAVVFRGQLTPLALAFTISGRGPGMAAACVLAIGIYAALRLPLAVPLLMALSQLVSQTVVEYAKTLFKRIRPDYWLVGLEAGHSYPSGHAVTATVFFIGWAVIAALGSLPGGWKVLDVIVLAAWALGIAWSRLALGAHYLTDVAGGVLFGGAWLCAVFLLWEHFHVILR